MIRELIEDVRELTQDQKVYQQEMKEIKIENEALKKENAKIEENMKNMEARMNRLEKEYTKNNLVISGLRIETEDKGDPKIEMENFIEKNMGIKIEIKDAIKTGEKLYKIKLDNTRDKEEAIKNKNNLRNFKERIYNISAKN
ncbi:hypothetical protein ILUMI_05236 [Ignelater luminosus]|uniref:Uncharacterized protein n=1 Tax=Ignelater luminosus TaxID=2038154 RepID=A0A8K0DI40_IGNLU|nr:hypothetical protein ILUMI_05236 [Ignelater luminosus]